MGFPVCYSDLLLPRFFLFLLSFLGQLRKLIALALRVVGLGDLLLDPVDSQPSYDPQRQDLHYRRHHLTHDGAAARIRSLLPVARYGDLGGADDDVPESCAVCLHEFGSDDEVRQLSNCRHVFHSGCIDPWVELDQRTCPLCRAALVPDELLRGGCSEVEWGSGEPLYPVAGPFRFVDSSQLSHPEPLPWFLFPSDDDAFTPELEVW